MSHVEGVQFEEYDTRSLVNVRKHVDSWFWTRYSAHPYRGCRAGCAFCYFRSGRYLGNRPPETFDHLIQVKRNAPRLLDRELVALERDAIFAGDWQQPAERRYRLSRAMLEVVHRHAFPLVVIERSPLLLDDVDLLQSIHEVASVTIGISFVGTAPALVRHLERRVASVRHRLSMMSTLAEAGVPVGAIFMPVVPVAGDHPNQLRELILAVADHGAEFVVAGSLTTGGHQSEVLMDALRRAAPDSLAELRQLYAADDVGFPTGGPPQQVSAWLGRTVRELCAQVGVSDRMPRYVEAGQRWMNRKLAERLLLQDYSLGLEEGAESLRWALRRAAWDLDDRPNDLQPLIVTEGARGLSRELGVSASIASSLVSWHTELTHLRPKGSPSPRAGRVLDLFES
ncbi:MAG: radical SAM protein [Alphaproteobacteria bacterium]|nr:radical SAM protein [Alphaproteobacteria bacterium]MCB9794807.1 radical SAM protein [Alphaproteobacteria bacterium]